MAITEPTTVVATTLGWGSAVVRLTGPADALDGLAAQVPPFYDRDGGLPDGAHVVEGTLRVGDGAISLDLPDGLGLHGPLGPETLRSAASQVELAVMDHQREHVVVHAGVVALGGRDRKSVV